MADRSLYETDIVAWSEQQAEALRAQARRGGDNAVDWDNIIEEIESVGRSQLASVESFLLQLLVHLLKLQYLPYAPARRHWRSELQSFATQITRRLSPAMKAKLDIASLWKDALKAADASLAEFEGALPRDVPRDSPLSLDQIVAALDDVDRLIASYMEATGHMHRQPSEQN